MANLPHLEFKWQVTLGFETILAIMGIVFAWRQFFDAGSHTRRLKEIVDSVSTRFIGRFPANLVEIVNVIKQSQSDLEILLDVAAYGHYSAPSIFENYKAMITSKCSKIDQCVVRMLIHDPEAYAKYRQEVYPKSGFDEEQKRPRFIEFFASNPQLAVPRTWEAFQECLRLEQARHLREMHRAGVDVRIMKDPPPMLLWIEDSKDAVFSFVSTAEHKEVSFRTRDGSLIGELHGIFERAVQHSIAFVESRSDTTAPRIER